jgi:hypothetical protein
MISSGLSLFLASLATQAPAQAPPAETGSQNITVVGRRIQDQREVLARCLARNCPPNEDIDATLGLAEMQFEAGDYRGARQTMRESVGRNRRHAAAYPVPVSDLYRSLSRVASHMGEEREARLSALRIGETLEAGFGAGDPRLLGARMEYANTLLTTGDRVRAIPVLEDLERDARRAGRADVADMAQLRLLWIRYLGGQKGPVKAQLERLARASAPADRFLSVGATVLLAGIHRREGDARTADALIAQLGRMHGGQRAMIFQPPYQLRFQGPAVEAGGFVGADDLRNSTVSERTWIDVGFWINPDGTVRDLEVVREGEPHVWAEPLLEAIRGRRYSASADGSATYRLERYTYTANLEARTGSLSRQRSTQGRVEYLDLTREGAEPGEPPAPGRQP